MKLAENDCTNGKKAAAASREAGKAECRWVRVIFDRSRRCRRGEHWASQKSSMIRWNAEDCDKTLPVAHCCRLILISPKMPRNGCKTSGKKIWWSILQSIYRSGRFRSRKGPEGIFCDSSKRHNNSDAWGAILVKDIILLQCPLEL